MCFRPASTTIGARICKSCHNVVDDIEANKCPHCGEPLEASFVAEKKASESSTVTSSENQQKKPPAPPSLSSQDDEKRGK